MPYIKGNHDVFMEECPRLYNIWLDNNPAGEAVFWLKLYFFLSNCQDHMRGNKQLSVQNHFELSIARML